MNIAELLIGVAGIVGGAKALKKGLGDAEDERERKKIETVMTATPFRTAVYRVNNINQRIAWIADLVRKGRDDPRIREFATKAISKRCGQKWCVTEKDYLGEVKAVYSAVRGTVRYARDTYGKDLFQHPARTLQFGSGDCFPGGTLFLTRDGFVPVEQVEVGDEIHDGERWVAVLKTWDRGPKRVLRFTLNNGCVLRISDTHKMLAVPRVPRETKGKMAGRFEDAVEVIASEIKVGDELLQPRGFAGAGEQELSDDDAFLFGAYLAEGCRSHKVVGGPDEWISIAGVKNGKGIRERVVEILTKRQIRFDEREREIRFHARDFPASFTLGRIAIEKQLPTFRFGPKTVANILKAMEMGDGGWSTSEKNMVYSTISTILAMQYRVLKRMMGQSVSWHTVVEHGGFGRNPIHRLTVRNDDNRRPWAVVKSIEAEEIESWCYDVMTESGRVYLPEADVITRQCDDYSILIAALLQSVGYPVKLRVIRTRRSPDWNHIYNMVGLPPRAPSRWIPVDGSVGYGVGWQAPKGMVAQHRDFLVT